MNKMSESAVFVAALAVGAFFLFRPSKKKDGRADPGVGTNLPGPGGGGEIFVKYSDGCESFSIDGISFEEILSGFSSASPSGRAAKESARSKISSKSIEIYNSLKNKDLDFIGITQSVIDKMVSPDCRFKIVGEEPLTLAQGLLVVFTVGPVLGQMKTDELADVYSIHAAIEEYGGKFSPVSQDIMSVKKGFIEDNVAGLYQVWNKL